MPKLPNRRAGILRRIVTKKTSDLLSSSSHDYPQSVTFSFKHLPEAESWKNGEKYHLVMQVEQQSSNKDSATFHVIKVGVGEKPESKVDDAEDYKDKGADETKEGD